MEGSMLVSRPRWISAAAPLAIAATLFVSQTSAAQRRQQLPAGTAVPVRTSAAINVKSADGQVHTGVVDENVLDANGNVAIPQGSTAELIVTKTSDSDLALDLDSITVDGQRYAIVADQNAVGTAGTVETGAKTIGKNKKTATYIGGG